MPGEPTPAGKVFPAPVAQSSPLEQRVFETHSALPCLIHSRHMFDGAEAWRERRGKLKKGWPGWRGKQGKATGGAENMFFGEAVFRPVMPQQSWQARPEADATQRVEDAGMTERSRGCSIRAIMQFYC